ncbi:Peptidyl-prolyl cis-trans isomerase pin4 [Malassezia cuniculi]|uniref:Peptidyl-prolyl cis-trans isomerase pin4 n=1 Tax=Malassezia cuniculi TaxID=948313 RepID=A0AAF0JAR6_9BASI|nr:Peptidyl-prolyl cis-trans isomerase pin4 [Malassezia cuniculi]
MADQALLNSLDALSIRREGASTHVSPSLGGDAPLSDSYLSRKAGPLDSFAPFAVPQSDGGVSSSRFQHLFHEAPQDDSFTPPVPIDNGFDTMFAVPPQGLPAQPSGLPMRTTPYAQYGSPWGASAPLGVGDGVPLAGQPLLSGQPIRFGAKSPTGDADIIPTAIVIKNIPFNIKREQLLQVIRDLGTPVPYAFNYHFDQGIFRGLAFANFHTPSEASEVVAALNGLDVSGRKLRVEYKKVLQAGEKERIEKEKALKRMHYAQAQERERKKDRGADPSGALSNMHKDTSNTSVHVPSATGEIAENAHIDLNDASTLEIYSRVLLFRDDRMRDELSFSRNLSASERHVVHVVAQKLGLFHYTLGDGDDRHVIVTKAEMPQYASRGSSALGVAGQSDRLVPPIVRTKKSAPDMKRVMPDLDGPMSRSNLLPVSSGIVPRKSNSNLSDKYSFADGRFDSFDMHGPLGNVQNQNLFASPFDIPVVPVLPRPSSVDIDRLDKHRHNKLSSAMPPQRTLSPLINRSSPVSAPLSQLGAPGVEAVAPHRRIPTFDVSPSLDGQRFGWPAPDGALTASGSLPQEHDTNQT